MKKLLSTALIAIIISSTMVDTINAAIERSTIRRSAARRRAPQRRRSLIRKKRTLPVAKQKTSPEQLKKTAQQSARDTKKLQIDVKKSETGKVPETTVVTDAKKIEANINKIEQQLANLRTWSGDVLPGGYSLEEKNKAFEIAAPFIKESEALKQQIIEIKKKISDPSITTKTYLGWGTPTVNPGKEKEYAIYNGMIKAAEARIAKLEPLIAQQEIIMGTRRSNAIKAAYASMAVAAIVAANIASGYVLSEAAKTAVFTVADKIAYYTPTIIKAPIAWAVAKAKAGIWGAAPTVSATVAEELGSQAVQQAIKGELVNKAAEQSAIILFGQDIWNSMVASGRRAAIYAVSDAVSTTTRNLITSLLVNIRLIEPSPANKTLIENRYKELDILEARARAEEEEAAARKINVKK
jgi:hypothetical protein